MGNDTPPPGSANLPIGGTPTIIPHWHSRGYLPHFECPGVIQHITFHLADSLPKQAARQLLAEIENLPADEQDIKRRKRIHTWLDAGYGSCILRQPDIAQMVEDALLYFDLQRYHLLAWVVMPNHVHVLFQPMDGRSVAKIVATWKKFTARKICDWKKMQVNNANLEIGDPRGKTAPVWHREYWDRYIRDERHLANAITYIHMNPVKAGLLLSLETGVGVVHTHTTHFICNHGIIQQLIVHGFTHRHIGI
jgi:REP element-mobilizing transposase RayT